ncbi:integrase/recombinase XerD [Clostridium beijerinckii]|uniref:tyrosine-type recombinase/integrase n=1 Tax=Clostridium beijerinckii TaxID=1520 RepID=UPI00156D5D6A|nr:tyrosine-type recombinase/integrase [Clostridium beijerinckii]NRT32615.1 integrase/recombinase XerD [Clostridium beijerinckii]NRT47957.1 integrase/recombinase XerD [Clostridium beijerinckii]NRZ23747.1 integrase/recombinase XerD [Clostridium beijerinckii]
MRKGEKVGKVQFNTNDKKQKPYDEVLEEYCELCKRRGLAEITIKGYRYSTRYFKKFNENTLINRNTILDYIKYLQDNDVKWTTINSYIRKLTPVLNYAFEMGYYPKVKVEYVKGQKEAKEIYSQEELQLLLEKPKKKDFVTIRNWAMTWVFASTGIRRTELINLKVSNVNLLERTLLLNTTKNKNARYVPVSSSLYDVLCEYIELRNGKNSDYLFPTVYNTKMSTSAINKELQNYNLSKGVLRSSIHAYRHTFITNAVNSNVNILLLKKITGHSSTTTLSGYYNAKINDTLDIIDTIAPKSDKRHSKFTKIK